MNYKLLFVDIDGTIFDHSTQSIHPSTIYALQKVKESNIKIILCSGRNYSMAKELGVTSAINIDGGIFLNGGITYYNSKVIASSTLDNRTINKIIDYAEKRKLTLMVCSLNETYLCTPNSDEFVTLQDYLHVSKISYKKYNKNDLVQLILTLNYFDEREFVSLFPNVKINRWHDYGVDIMPLNNSKATGILALIKHLSVKNEECIAIGDGLNDIEMLQTCGLKIAMANASDKLKAIATYVTSDVKKEGIYDAIKHYAPSLNIKDF